MLCHLLFAICPQASPPADPLVNRCIECGFCESNCPSRDVTITPRQVRTFLGGMGLQWCWLSLCPLITFVRPAVFRCYMDCSCSASLSTRSCSDCETCPTGRLSRHVTVFTCLSVPPVWCLSALTLSIHNLASRRRGCKRCSSCTSTMGRTRAPQTACARRSARSRSTRVCNMAPGVGSWRGMHQGAAEYHRCRTWLVLCHLPPYSSGSHPQMSSCLAGELIKQVRAAELSPEAAPRSNRAAWAVANNFGTTTWAMNKALNLVGRKRANLGWVG